MAPYKAIFKGLESGNEFSLDEVVYKDRDGSLLDVVHDIEALKQRTPEEWKEIFQLRAGSMRSPYNSGVWGKKEWVLPDIPDDLIVSLHEGWTSLLKPKKLCDYLNLEDLWVKLCGNSHTGSFKDLGMTVLVSQVNYMIKKGLPIKAVACASTGDTSAALAAYCAFVDIPSIVFLPRGKISTAQLIQPISNGAHVVVLDTDFDGCMKIVQEVTKDKSLYLANSMNSLRIEGQKTISIEICQQLRWEVPDIVIIPGGNLGNVSALGNGFRMMLETGLIEKKPVIVVAQAANANPLYLAYQNGFQEFKPVVAKDTLASAIRIGDPVSYKRAVRALQDFSGQVVEVTEEELANAAHLTDRSGLYCCPHTGVALGALLKLVDRKEIGAHDKVVVISTAHGLKFSEFKVKYHEKALPDIAARFANPISYCEANADKVRDVIGERLG